MFAAGKRVKALVKIQSDDRTISGMDDGTPIVPAGTEGTLIGWSKDSAPEGTTMKVDDCWLVDFDGNQFDVSETEMELV